MNVSEKDFLYLKEQVTANMIAILTEEQGLPLEQAIDKVYSSELFQKHRQCRDKAVLSVAKLSTVIYSIVKHQQRIKARL